jgi:ubiquinone/menaquinone biosynthesis C-methylase UbiE
VQPDRTDKVHDNEFDTLPATRSMRDVIWRTYYQYFRTGDSLLELNCGTGVDTMELASNGIHILATDSSEEMIATTVRKLSSTGVSPYVQARRIKLHNLNTLDGLQFDGVLSNFGGLNYTRYLDAVARELGRLVRPGGFAVFCMMSKYSVWGMLSDLLRRGPLKAIRRFGKDGTLLDVNREKVWVHRYSPKEIVRVFSTHFTPVDGFGLNIFAPPPSARTFNKLLRPFRPLLEKLDAAVARNKFFYALGGHFVIVLRRKG